MERLTQWFGSSRLGREAGMASKYDGVYTEEELINVLLSHLAAYEDTGLEPEEVKDLIYRFEKCRAIRAALCDPTGQPIAEPSYIRNLLQADKSGRLVVPPCKEWDTVYYIEAPHGQWRYYKLRMYTVSHLIISNDGVCVMVRELTAPGMCLCRGEDFGRIAFINEEDAKKRLDELNKEAEAALRKEERNGKD